MSAPRTSPPAAPIVASVFVTGTGTGVGKTYVTAALSAALLRRGQPALAIKPVETGVADRAAPGSDAAILARACGAPPGLGSVYALRAAASPHLAASVQGLGLDESEVLRRVAALARESGRAGLLLIEGAGGLRVPLRPGYEMIDLCRDLRAPALLVARAGLGTLNETLLSLEALERRRIPILGTVLNQVEAAADRAIVADNLAYLRRHAPGGVLGLLPWSAGDRLDEHVDLDALLVRLRGL